MTFEQALKKACKRYEQSCGKKPNIQAMRAALASYHMDAVDEHSDRQGK